MRAASISISISVGNDGGGMTQADARSSHCAAHLVLEPLARWHDGVLVNILAEDGRIVARVEDEVRSGLQSVR